MEKISSKTDTIDYVTSLEQRIESLLEKHRSLKDNLDEKNKENDILKNKIHQYEEQLNYFHDKVEISKIVDYLGLGESDVASLRTKLDEFIKDIDRCITQVDGRL